MTSAADVQATFAAVVVDEWARAGITDLVVCPGSRSTPILAALAADERLRLHVVLDERSAGFVALGMGMATGRPAPVVTTSGTAAVELHPAVVEAHQAGVPLLAVTADRPTELHGVGAPQTVVQEGLYGSSLRWQASPGVPDPASMGSWRPLASRSVAATFSDPRGPGPVHLNLAFREPLLGAASSGPPGRSRGAPWHHAMRLDGESGHPGPGLRSVGPVPGLGFVLEPGSKGLIVVGGGGASPEAVAELAVALGWPVLADPRSGCRVPGAAIVVAAADAILRVPAVASGAAWRPDTVLRLGQPWASKVVGEWLAGLGPDVTQIIVDPYGQWADPGRQVAEIVVADPTAVCRSLLAGLEGTPRRDSAWQVQWSGASAAAQGAIDEVLARPHGALSEPGIARRLLASIPNGSILVTSSSMPVRDVEWYGAPRAGVRVVANRGTNGIDGMVSTTLGVALGSQAPTFGLIGDLAFLYDAAALLWAPARQVDCTFVVVDNDGGGIFSFLPQAKGLPPTVFSRLWSTPHGLDVGAVAASYGVPVTQISHAADLDALAAGSSTPRARVAVVRTDRTANVAWHDRIHQAVAAAIA